MSEQFHQSPVSRAVWSWQEQEPGTVSVPPLGKSVLVLVVGVAAAGLFWYGGHLLASLVVAGLAVLLFGLSRAMPRMYYGVERVMAIFGRFVGRLLTWLLLVPFYYLCFPIGRLIQRLKGRDPLNRRYELEQSSYWHKRQPADDPEQYGRQY